MRMVGYTRSPGCFYCVGSAGALSFELSLGKILDLLKVCLYSYDSAFEFSRAAHYSPMNDHTPFPSCMKSATIGESLTTYRCIYSCKLCDSDPWIWVRCERRPPAPNAQSPHYLVPLQMHVMQLSLTRGAGQLAWHGRVIRASLRSQLSGKWRGSNVQNILSDVTS